jgi:hypothetical protein
MIERKDKGGRGPLGIATNVPILDEGTLARTQHCPPGHHSDDASHLKALQIALKKTQYLAYAREISYLMQAKSAVEGAWEEIKQLFSDDQDPNSARVQSFLGGAFLRMYLDGKVDPNIIAQAGQEIGQSTEFQNLSEKLKKHMQEKIDRLKVRKIDLPEFAKMADAYLKDVKAKSGIAFKRTLNPVIGGVTDVAVKSITYLGNVTQKGLAGAYRIDITFYDVYDFANKRRGEYDRYRKELARYLLADDFEKFEKTYNLEIRYPIDFDKKQQKTQLENSSVFASFMYALEKKGWTPGGLAWNVTVPAEVILVIAQK